MGILEPEEGEVYGWEEEKKSPDQLTGYALLDFVASQEQGYGTQDNGQSSNLSGGQKQRIAIMRAVIITHDKQVRETCDEVIMLS